VERIRKASPCFLLGRARGNPRPRADSRSRRRLAPPPFSTGGSSDCGYGCTLPGPRRLPLPIASASAPLPSPPRRSVDPCRTPATPRCVRTIGRRRPGPCLLGCFLPCLNRQLVVRRMEPPRIGEGELGGPSRRPPRTGTPSKGTRPRRLLLPLLLRHFPQYSSLDRGCAPRASRRQRPSRWRTTMTGGGGSGSCSLWWVLLLFRNRLPIPTSPETTTSAIWNRQQLHYRLLHFPSPPRGMIWRAIQQGPINSATRRRRSCCLLCGKRNCEFSNPSPTGTSVIVSTTDVIGAQLDPDAEILPVSQYHVQ
jgi:hypothetical protein